MARIILSTPCILIICSLSALGLSALIAAVALEEHRDRKYAEEPLDDENIQHP